MFFLNLYVLEKFVYFFKCDNVKLKRAQIFQWRVKMGKMYTKNMAVVILLVFIVIGISGIFIGCKGKETKTVEITDKTPHLIGSFQSTPEGNIMYSTKGQSGFLVFGPYWPLKEGKYRVRFNLMASGEPNQEVARIDVNVMDKLTNKPAADTIEQKIMSTDKAEWKKYTIDFTAGKNENGNLLYEFRVFATGTGDVKIKGIFLERL